MGKVYLSRLMFSNIVNHPKAEAYDYEEELSSAGDGNIILMPAGNLKTSVGIIINDAGAGKVQYSITPVWKILEDEDNAEFLDWSLGTVTSSTIDELSSPVSALKLVNSSGTVKIQIRTQG